MLIVNFENKTITADNHVLETYRTCEEKYRLMLLEHWRPQTGAPALAFGLAMHAARAKYKREMMTLHTHSINPAAREAAIAVGLNVWEVEMPPEMKTEVMVDDKRSKLNFERLARGYFAKYGGPEFEPLQVDVPGKQVLGMTPNGWRFTYVYTIDEIVRYGNKIYPLEFKTDGGMWPPGDQFFAQFNNKASITGYIWACEKHFGYKIAGAIIHSMWVHPEPKPGSKSKYGLPDYFKMDYSYRDDAQIEEWKRNTLLTGDDIVRSVEENRWKKDQGFACSLYGGCAMNRVCRATPGVRDAVLKMDYARKEWNPWARVND